MTLENWVVQLLEEIKEAAEKDKNFNLSLNRNDVHEIAEAYDKTAWIEIY